jgi:hypothetical protein
MKSTPYFKYTEVIFNCFSTIVCIKFGIGFYRFNICRSSSEAVIYKFIEKNFIKMHLHISNFHLLQFVDVLKQVFCMILHTHAKIMYPLCLTCYCILAVELFIVNACCTTEQICHTELKKRTREYLEMDLINNTTFTV